MMLLLAGLAQAAEYRKVELADGRLLTVEYVATEADGVRIRVPQGTVKLPFEAILSFQPADESAYLALAPLKILVLPMVAQAPASAEDAARIQSVLAAEAARVPNAEVQSLAQAAPYGTPAAAAALAVCGGDAACIGLHVAPYHVDLVLGGTVGGSGADDLALAAVFPPFPTASRTAGARVTGNPEVQHEAARRALYGVLGLDVPATAVIIAAVPVPEPVAEPVPIPEPVVPRARRSVSPALALVPIPGIAQFASGDVGHGVAAAAVVVPGTVGLVYLAGRSGSRKPEVIGLGIAGYWALCAVTGRAWLPAVTPVEGGAQVGVGGSF